MIENEIAKLEKPDQRPVQVLLVAELGEVLLVVGEVRTSWSESVRVLRACGTFSGEREPS